MTTHKIVSYFPLLSCIYLSEVFAGISVTNYYMKEVNIAQLKLHQKIFLISFLSLKSHLAVMISKCYGLLPVAFPQKEHLKRFKARTFFQQPTRTIKE